MPILDYRTFIEQKKQYYFMYLYTYISNVLINLSIRSHGEWAKTSNI